MTPSRRVLIVDDDPDFVAIYREMLEEQGLDVMVAHTANDATVTLEQLGSQLDVVLLDQKLQGGGGPDSGLDLISSAKSLAPFAKIVVVTGYATPEAIERAFALGVYDYLVKNGAFAALLGAKVRNAVEVTGERRIAALTREETVTLLRSVLAEVQTESDRNRKGKLLEDLVKLLFRATPGFNRVDARLDNSVEEIDIVVENHADDAPWTHEGAQYLLGECKNWSKPCGSPEFRDFHAKLTTKYGRARTGFFIAPGGFTSKFQEARAQHASGNVLVIPIGTEDLERWIGAEDRLSVLGDLHKRAVLG